jgi:hypothetical protein
MTYTYKLSRRLAAAHDPLSDVRRVMILLLLLLAISCRDSLTNPSGSQPNPSSAKAGWVSVVLNTPNSNDGAVQLSLTGAPIDSLELQGNRGFASIVNGTGHLLVTGDIRSGVVARMWVPDLSAASRYQGSIVAAAAKSTYQLQDISRGYSVRVTR